MSITAEALRAAVLAHADSVIKKSGKWLGQTLREHPDSEGDPLVLLDACADLIAELQFRLSTSEDPKERRIRFARNLSEIEVVQQMVQRARQREREGVGTLNEDSRWLAQSVERRLSALRLVLRDWLDAEKSTKVRQERTRGGVRA